MGATSTGISLTYDEHTVTMSPDRIDAEGRHVWTFEITGPDGDTHRGDDLRSGAHGVGSEPWQMARTLGCFLEAYVEAQGYERSENRDLFPGLDPEVADMVAEAIRLECGIDGDEEGE